MQFDDRLATVLRHRAHGDGAARTQYRQLLDLLGTPGRGEDPSLQEAARLRLESLSETISVRERAEIIREQGRRISDPRLVAQFAEAEPDIASATLANARMSQDAWLGLIPRLPVRARGFLRLRQDLPRPVVDLLDRLGVRDRALPLPPDPEPLVEDAPEDQLVDDDDTILDAEFTEIDDDTPSVPEPEPEPAQQAEPEPEPIPLAAAPTEPAESEPESDPAPQPSPQPSTSPSPSPTSDLKPRETPSFAGAMTPAAAAAAVAAALAAEEGDEEEDWDEEAEAQPAEAAPEPRPAAQAPIGEQPQPATATAALRQRIDSFQRARAEGAAPVDSSAPPLPFAEHLPREQKLGGFGFTTDTSGVIDWADPSAAPRVLYLSLTTLLPEELVGVIERQQPLRGVPVTLEGGPAIEGNWILDMNPRFGREDGRFLGHAGGMRRVMENDAPVAQSDRLRQMLHELRTPVNAIQGFAEVIQQQMFGQVPHDYRALAAGIAGDSARMMAGFDDLERLARLESGKLRPGSGDADLAAIMGQHIRQLTPLLAPRDAAFIADIAGPCQIDLSRQDAELLSWRILATLGSAAAPSEKLRLRFGCQHGQATFDAELPASLNGSEDIFAARGKPLSVSISAGPFGPGFALRLARAEARALGGSLRREGRRLMLALPALTAGSSTTAPDTRVPETAA